ncbi:hypothetical protein [Arachidicoccus terrestris]|jgi:hypothetical protein|uniref:hypothetical protein n=1 Tax=Arachidicoccus terrestris TaxID=2875539 RepID=UPI001CC5C902|nr:hypothetical protein [Arachidicoccus terrestris]UAY54103.1 hypothetical protein K9M52_11555 [Arachidicoccus terrestris]
MIKIQELKQGDFVIAVFEDVERRGTVAEVAADDKMARVITENGKQDFWYDMDHVFPIALSDAEMGRFGFDREILPDGAIKYKKNAFRLVIPRENDFSEVEIWYREDIRKNPNVHAVHQLQNHFHQMTKIYLEEVANTTII